MIERDSLKVGRAERRAAVQAQQPQGTGLAFFGGEGEWSALPETLEFMRDQSSRAGKDITSDVVQPLPPFCR